MPELPLIMINDFLDDDIRGIFTSLYIEPEEMLLRHNLTGTKLRFSKKAEELTLEMFSLTKGWLKIRHDVLPSPVTLSPLLIPSSNEIEESENWDVSLEEFRKYNGKRYLKNLALLLGEDPEMMDGVPLENPLGNSL